MTSQTWWKTKESRVGKVRFRAIQEDLYRAKAHYERERNRIKERKQKYASKLPACIYPVWRPLKGRGKLGEFPLMVVAEHYRKQGYTVWFSGSDAGIRDRFILVSYPGLRKQKALHPAYKRMLRFFGRKKVEELNGIVDGAKRKRKATRNLGGGDPDLFVFKRNPRKKRFFVEVKHKDQPTPNQRICFPLIDQHLCEVKLVRIAAAG